jgi:hypothetical protein
MTTWSYCREQDSSLNYIIQTLVFRCVDLSLIVYVDLFVYELNFMNDKRYCAELSGKQSVAS